MIFLKLLPDVQSDIHLVQRNIVLKLYGSFEHLKDSFHNKNDSPWCVCVFFFSLFLVLKGCINILFSKKL